MLAAWHFLFEPSHRNSTLGTGGFSSSHVHANAGYGLPFQPCPLATRILDRISPPNLTPAYYPCVMTLHIHRILTFSRAGYLFAISTSTSNAEVPRPEPQNRRVPSKFHLLHPIK